jgi:hypothetical protein
MRKLFPLLAALLLVLAVGDAAAAEDPGNADVTLEGDVRFTDLHHYIEAPFVVPAGTSRMTVVLSHDGAANRTTIDLGLRDPERFRGWSGGARMRFVVSATDASPGYLPGPLPPGRWVLILGVPNIRAGVVTHYQARIFFGRPGMAVAVSRFSDAPLRSGPAWFRGDLHMHSANSDGSCLSRSGVHVPCPTFRTVEAADARKLDFIAISDHNTASQNQALRELQPYFDRTLLIPAQELTTFTGHANAIGVVDPIDFRVDGVHVADANALADAVHRAGGLFSINHPALPSGEICMGCGWTAPGFDFARADAVEVVNGGAVQFTGAADGPGSGLPFWRNLLNAGLHPTAVGGSDNHDPDHPPAVGSPTTVIWASELSERALLAGLKAGHVFIDVDSDPARRLEVWADTGAGRVMMGDRLALAAGRKATLTVQTAGAPGGRLEIMRDGSLIADPGLTPALEADAVRTLTLTGDGRRHWVQALVRDAKGRLILISNPIYFEGRGGGASAQAVTSR